jgi:hypothetical protein
MKSSPYFRVALCGALSLLGFAACGSEDDRAPLRSNDPPIDQEIYEYCADFCDNMTCEDARNTGCRNNCENWLAVLDETCGDSIRETFDCHRELSCAELEAFYEEGREHEACGPALVDQVAACAPEESPGCKAFCDLAIECDDTLALICEDNCRMNEALFEANYGAACREAADALFECEGGTTCGDLQLLQSSNYVPDECKGLEATFNAECR